MNSESPYRRRVVIVASVAGAILALSALVAWRANNLRATAIDFWARPVASTASVMKTTLERWVLERRRDAKAAAGVAAIFWPALGEPHAEGSAHARGLATSLDRLARAGDFSAIWVVDPSGRRFASSTLAGEPPASVVARLASIIAADSAVVLGPERGKAGEWDVYFAAPVVLRAGDPSAQSVGVVILRADPEPYLYPLIASPPIVTASGRTLLAARNGDTVFVIAPATDSAVDAVDRAFAWGEAPLPLRHAIEGRTDVVISEDYRGVSALAVPRRIEPVGWGIVRQFDEADVVATAHRQLRLELLALMGLLIAVGSVVLIVRRALRMERMQRQLVRLELDHLKSQLQPHFLFNALNAIAQELHSDPDKAEGMIVRLGDLLRMSLELGKRQEVRLREELGLMETYLEIERVRSGDRLFVAMDVDEQALDAMVPVLVLQPLVENAIRHGISRISGKGVLHVRGRVRGDQLELVVEDNGVGLDDRAHRVGVGVSNTLLRLQQLYGDDCRLELSARDGGGTIATITFPLNYEMEPATGEWRAWPVQRGRPRRGARLQRQAL